VQPVAPPHEPVRVLRELAVHRDAKRERELAFDVDVAVEVRLENADVPVAKEPQLAAAAPEDDREARGVAAAIFGAIREHDAAWDRRALRHRVEKLAHGA